MSKIGFRTEHAKWFDLKVHAKLERDRGNAFPNTKGLIGYEGIWVTHSAKDARRYGDDIWRVDLTNAKIFHSDGDGGFLYVRQKGSV